MRIDFKGNEPFFSRASLKIAVLLIAAVYGCHFLLLGFLESPYDYDALASFYEIAWRYWKYGSGFPHFNPLLCGGRPLAADPQTPIYNPMILLVELLGAVWTVKIELMGQLALGVAGLLGIFRRWNVGIEEKWWCVLCYLCGGAVVNRFMVGHITLGYYLMLPLFFHFSYYCHDGPRSARWLVAYWALFTYGFLHKPNFWIQVVPVLFLETLIRSWSARTWRPFLHLGLATAVGFSVNAATYYPAFEYFRLYPRGSDGTANSTPFHTLFLSLLFPIKTLPEKLYGLHFMGRHEYSIFLGPVPFLMAVAGVASAIRRSEIISLLALMIASALLGLGTETERLGLSPYTWLYHFWPGFQSVRVPPRFWFGVFLPVILFSSIGFRRLRLPGPRWFWYGLTVVPLLLNGVINLSKVVSPSTQWSVPSRYHSQFRWVATDPDKTFKTVRQGEGALNCHFNMNIPQAKLAPGPALPTYEGARIEWQGWNRILLEWETPGQFSIDLNLNHSPFWRFTGTGAVIVSRDKEPLHLALSGTSLRGILSYEMPSVIDGLWISMAAVFLVLLVLGAKIVYDKKVMSPSIRRIGLTGNIGSGKSEVAKILAGAGLAVINLDELGRNISRDPSVERAIASIFGSAVIHHGKLDRHAVRRATFQSPEKRKALEELLHPKIWQTFEEMAQKIHQSGRRLVICEAALLFETGLDEKLDAVVVVSANEGVRRDRLFVRDQMTPEEFDQIAKAQLSEAENLKKAAYIIDNSETIEMLRPQVASLINRWKIEGLC